MSDIRQTTTTNMKLKQLEYKKVADEFILSFQIIVITKDAEHYCAKCMRTFDIDELLDYGLVAPVCIICGFELKEVGDK